jgi:peroxiredoxin
VQYPAKFRLEVWSEAQPDARLTVVSDEQSVTRWMAATNAYSQSTGGDPWQALQEDSLTAQTMEATGADFLIRADLQGFLSTRLVRVEDLGNETADNRTLRRFHLALANGREVVARIVEGEAVLPVELTTSFLVPISDQASFRMSIDTKLKWTFNEAIPAETFVLSLPAGARRVGDLMDSMLGEESKETVGQAAPELSFVGLDEKPVSLAEYRNKAIVVLYFWASWAAPSTDRMPDLNKFVQEFSKLGVQFLAVNVGEHPADAKAYVEKLGYRGRVVRDPEALAMAALKISELPAVAVLAKDGTVQLLEDGVGPELREKVQQTLEAILRGNAR